MTTDQANTINNMGLDPAEAEWRGQHAIIPWRHGGFVIVNPHGGASIYPEIMREHALEGIPQ